MYVVAEKLDAIELAAALNALTEEDHVIQVVHLWGGLYTLVYWVAATS